MNEEWLKEAERLAEAYGTAMLHNDTDGSERAALMAHLARAAVPAVQPQSLLQRSLDSLKALMYRREQMTAADFVRATLTIHKLQEHLFGKVDPAAAPQAEARQEQPKQPDSVYLTSSSGEAATERDGIGDLLKDLAQELGPRQTGANTVRCRACGYAWDVGAPAHHAADCLHMRARKIERELAALSSTPAQGDAEGVTLPDAAKLVGLWFDEWELILPPDARESFHNDLMPSVRNAGVAACEPGTPKPSTGAGSEPINKTQPGASGVPGLDAVTADAERLCWALRPLVRLVPAGSGECWVRFKVGSQEFTIGNQPLPEDEAAHFAGLFVFALAGAFRTLPSGVALPRTDQSKGGA